MKTSEIALIPTPRVVTFAADGKTAPARGKPAVSVDPAASAHEEGYVLDISADGTVVIKGHDEAGAFYGLQTFTQLARQCEKSGVLPVVHIEDWPRFRWRGLMLDPARYFLTLDFLKRYVDLAAQYKLNRLHLHLTDDLGWTIEILQYPELTDMTRWPMTPASRNRGVYTQAELRELVAYAAERYVVVMPEIEMPGHNGIPAWALREQVLCSNNPCRDRATPWDENETYKWTEPCAASPTTQAVYENILREVLDVFPGPYIHLGADEYFGLAWAQCPECQALVQRVNLRQGETDELKRLFSNCLGSRDKYLVYRHLMTRMCDFVAAQGRQPVLWDDLAWRGTFPAKAVIMQWHYEGGHDAWQRIATPENPAAEAARAGRDAIIAPYSHLYFDLNSTLEAVHSLDPMPAGLSAPEQARILGPHAPLWNQPQLEMDARAFPRLYALAEIGWSPASPQDWAGFSHRVERHEAQRLR
ncbi:MAG: beta-N-acetylhexosaminidase [Lentisphaerae bacterium]|nr:beta-N-acetylhexosaminidase [Lentisphaerota bacterium]